jgi:hypothetical protein
VQVRGERRGGEIDYMKEDGYLMIDEKMWKLEIRNMKYEKTNNK